MSIRVFKHENLTAIHRPGVVRFEYALVGVTVVGTIKEIDDVAQADWNVGLIPMKLVFADAIDMDSEELDSLPEGIAKRTLIENSMWLIGDRLANWFVEAELQMSLEQVQRQKVAAN